MTPNAQLIAELEHVAFCDYTIQKDLLDRAIAALSQDAAIQQEPRAWLQYRERDNGATTIHLCNSDAPGAFKVYAHPQPSTQPQPDADHDARVRNLAIEECVDKLCRMGHGGIALTIKTLKTVEAK